MSTIAPEFPVEHGETLVFDLAGMPSFLIDPQAAAKRVFTKWFWVGPLILFSLVSFIASYLMMPMIQHVLEVSPIPANTSPEQYQKGIDMGMKIQHITMYLAPLTVAALYAIQTLIVFAMCSILAVNAKFRSLFNLIAGCSLIQLLAAIASLVILKAKGEVSTMAELRPALGLDIFLPEGTSKYAAAFLGYFSVFELWWIVMMVLILSSAFRVSKGKAFAILLPLILLSIAFRVGSAAMQRS
jgi:hypothetical protein